VDAPVPIRHENLTSAQDCPGFWIRSNEPRRNEHAAVKCASESGNPPDIQGRTGRLKS
jgi:hypothetical protein